MPHNYPTDPSSLQSLASRIQSCLSSHSLPALHDLVPVTKTSFYGYHTQPSLFLKLSFYDKDITKELMKIVSSGEIGLRLQPYEAHIDVFQHFYAEYNLRGVDFMRVEACSYRKPVKVSLITGEFVTNGIPKASPSQLEADCHCSKVVKRPIEVSPDFPGIEIPSITTLWLEQIEASRQRGEPFHSCMAPLPVTTVFPHDCMQDPSVLLQFQYLAAMPHDDSKDMLKIEGTREAAGHVIVNEDDTKLVDDLLDISKPKGLVVKEKPKTPSIGEFFTVQTPEEKRGKELMSTDERFNSDQIRTFYNSSYAQRPSLKPKPDSAYPQLHLSTFTREVARGITNKELLDLAESAHSSRPATPTANPFQISPCTERSAQRAEKTQSQPREKSYLVFLYVEIIPETRPGLSPDPLIDPVAAIVYQTVDDYGESVDGVIAVNRFSIEKTRVFGRFRHSVEWADSEVELFAAFCRAWGRCDPDVVISFDTERESLNYLLSRAVILRFQLGEKLTRSVDVQTATFQGKKKKYAKRLYGRIVIDAWRMVKSEIKLHMHSFTNMVYHVFAYRVPKYSWDTLRQWLRSPQLFPKALDHFREKAGLTQKLIEHFGLFDQATQLARVYGIDLLSVFMRGSQFRVEAILKRYCLYNTDFLLLSATKAQVASQKDLESIPLVMEPPKAFSNDPVIVLDFQSLYPSILIAYNLCYTTALGKLREEGYRQFGVTNMKAEVFSGLKDTDVHVASNNAGYVKPNLRVGVLPRLAHVLLQTRIMTKRAMRKAAQGSSLYSKLWSQQMGIKLLCNTTYGYAGAGISGRMPCSDLADSIVGLARRTLENAQRIVSSNEDWGAEVIYGDTDSLMIKLPGRTVAQAFDVGKSIVAAINASNPPPIEILLEKVYCPFLSIAKKHYSGLKYDSPASVPVLESKGIETARRDNCLAVSLLQEKVLTLLFTTKDLYQVYHYLTRQWNKIQMGQVRLNEFVMYKKVLMGSYKVMPHAAIVCGRMIERDRMAAPHYGERVGYVVASAPPNTPLKDSVYSPEEFLAKGLTLNYEYYINNQILPVLGRVLEPVDVKVQVWYENFPRKYIQALPPVSTGEPQLGRLDQMFRSVRCLICNQIGETNPCEVCKGNTRYLSFHVCAKLAEIERQCRELTDVCRCCTQTPIGDIECLSLECPIFYQRTTLQRMLQTIGPVLSSEIQVEPMINAYLL